MIVKKILRKLIYGKKSTSEEYIKYLRSLGGKIGKGVYIFSPETTNIDAVRIDWIKIGDYTKISSGFTFLSYSRDDRFASP